MSSYLNVDLEATDASAYEEYRKRVLPLIASYGGRYLVRGGSTEFLEGAAQPNRTAVLAFPSMERLKAFHSSAEYAPLQQLRIESARSRIFAVEGI